MINSITKDHKALLKATQRENSMEKIAICFLTTLLSKNPVLLMPRSSLRTVDLVQG
jgi:hypothetical protein